jgi:hypothetical protein
VKLTSTTAIHLADRNGTIAITIADSGIGIPESDRERIFEPFYRGPDDISDMPGFSMGLAIVRKITRTVGGDVMRLVALDVLEKQVELGAPGLGARRLAWSLVGERRDRLVEPGVVVLFLVFAESRCSPSSCASHSPDAET